MASTVSTATPKPVQPPKDAWDIPPIPCHEPEDGVFYAQMGPTGGKRGYSAITGLVLNHLRILLIINFLVYRTRRLGYLLVY